MSSAGDSTEHVVHDAGDVGEAHAPVRRDPRVELGAPDEDLPADVVVRQRP
jgi:hypothetical protein